MTARTFSVAAEDAAALSRALAGARAAVGSPTGGVVFASGSLATRAEEIARIAHLAWRSVPLVVVPAAGVITEAGEHEGVAAIAGVLWSGGASTLVIVPGDRETAPPGTASGATLGAALAAAREGGASSVAIFPRPDAAKPAALEAELATARGLTIFGGGTAGPAAVAVTAEGELVGGPYVGLATRKVAAPIVASSIAGRLLCEPAPVDAVEGAAILRIGGKPALEVLSRSADAVGPNTPAASLVLAALADGDGGRFVLRAIRGIDPERRAILVGEGVAVGTRIAFAVRDPARARADLEATARGVAEDARGSAPRFALCFTCAGRGQGLYGAPNVESRILRQRFAGLPIAGMASSFEIAPGSDGAARVHLYAAVIALFRSPS